MGNGKRGRVGVIGGGLAAVVGGVALVATVVGGKGSGDEPSDKEPRGNKPPVVEPSTEPEPDALCTEHDVLIGAVNAIMPVEGPAELEAFVLAQLAFYTSAAEAEPEPDATAFRSMSAYYAALRGFYESRAWQQAQLTDIAQLPQPPTDGSATRTSQILADRCDVPIPTDNPTG